MRVSLFYLKLITILVVFLSLTSCASMDDHHGKMAATAIGAGLGAVAGLVIAQDPITGAIIGGSIGFVAGSVYDLEVKKNKNAPDVEIDYIEKTGAGLPQETIISKYSIRTEPENLIKRGDEIRFYSEIEVIKGRDTYGLKDRLEEELIISHDSQSEPKSNRKEVIDSSIILSGGYETKSTFRFVADNALAQGYYDYRKILYLNDDPVRESQGRFQIAIIDQKIHVVFLN